MRFITIDDVKPGMILARTVLDNAERVLLGAYNELTADLIVRLKKRGFQGLYIEDKLFEDIDIEEIIPPELRRKGIESLRNCNIDAVLDIAGNIVEQLLSHRSISLDLVDLRTFDDYTYSHSVNVAVLSTTIGIGMKLKKKELVDLCAAAIFHDLGKTRIDPAILNKPGRLTAEEFTIMKNHSRYSYELIKERWNISATTKQAVLYHHENEDGTGYPNGLVGKEIPLYSSIIHVSDVYDALTSKRPYKEPFALSEAIEYLMGGSGILFNRDIVETFLNYVPVYPRGVSVKLSDGREGIVIENHKKNILRPKIRLLSGEEIDLGDETKNRNITLNPDNSAQKQYGADISRRNDKLEAEKKHIIVVDDMVTNLKTVRAILEDEYKVTMLKSGEQVLRYLNQNKEPDLFLMDIDMPGLDGIETVIRIQEEFDPDIPVVFLSALSDRSTVMRCRQVGAKDYIVKPFKAVYVQERIRAVLGGYAEM